ncbi:MAG: hypothetical protein NC299_00780 [Lachnospiraceae bacterium]|nr:hypothetical protein [Ruminococcus sp.]MCM1273882.1 hypothetical protein [Lachnospiraceae bacterium]
MKFAAVPIVVFTITDSNIAVGAAEKRVCGMKFAAAPTVVFAIAEPKTRNTKV